MPSLVGSEMCIRDREQKEALKRFSETLGEGNYEKHRSFFGKKK